MDFNPGIDGPSEDVSRVLAAMLDTLTIAILPSISWMQIIVLKQRVYGFEENHLEIVPSMCSHFRLQLL
ncbi:hypothetical protein HanXRQr2_Chr01g0005471 [Helianthus annuus]|uniref:Uncharacterized protein n=1 Tax=Helianthus annuus TaxID=4232 RepID=A0A9K3JT06_HELAN|nr:hypothetical protein HanXRQr2_Chr01g0005471 [Helianthus annuus]KAJ0955645.1 hypothetical protein HanPSC8_Chr01g0005261 [Helianthus annuus]